MGNHQHQRSVERGLFGRRCLQAKCNLVWFNYCCVQSCSLLPAPCSHQMTGTWAWSWTLKSRPIEVSPLSLRERKGGGVFKWHQHKNVRLENFIGGRMLFRFFFTLFCFWCYSIPSCRPALIISMNWEFNFVPFCLGSC
jgi:hypothetical protein